MLNAKPLTMPKRTQFSQPQQALGALDLSEFEQSEARRRDFASVVLEGKLIALGKDASALIAATGAGIAVALTDLMDRLEAHGVRQFQDNPNADMPLDWHIETSQASGVFGVTFGLYAAACAASFIFRSLALKTPLLRIPGVVTPLVSRALNKAG